MLIKLAAALSLALSLPAIASAANSCDGNAADVVDVNWVQVTSWGGHYDTTNHGTRKVTVTFDLVAGGSFTLNLDPGQTQYPGFDSYHPLQSYKTPCHANYQ